MFLILKIALGVFFGILLVNWLAGWQARRELRAREDWVRFQIELHRKLHEPLDLRPIKRAQREQRRNNIQIPKPSSPRKPINPIKPRKPVTNATLFYFAWFLVVAIIALYQLSPSSVSLSSLVKSDNFWMSLSVIAASVFVAAFWYGVAKAWVLVESRLKRIKTQPHKLFRTDATVFCIGIGFIMFGLLGSFA